VKRVKPPAYRKVFRFYLRNAGLSLYVSSGKSLHVPQVKILKELHLWPVRDTAAYYRRVARKAPAFLVRAILLRAADRLR
jgi:hypothetical protein